MRGVALWVPHIGLAQPPVTAEGAETPSTWGHCHVWGVLMRTSPIRTSPVLMEHLLREVQSIGNSKLLWYNWMGQAKRDLPHQHAPVRREVKMLLPSWKSLSLGDFQPESGTVWVERGTELCTPRSQAALKCNSNPPEVPPGHSRISQPWLTLQSQKVENFHLHLYQEQSPAWIN